MSVPSPTKVKEVISEEVHGQFFKFLFEYNTLVEKCGHPFVVLYLVGFSTSTVSILSKIIIYIKHTMVERIKKTLNSSLYPFLKVCTHKK